MSFIYWEKIQLETFLHLYPEACLSEYNLMCNAPVSYPSINITLPSAPVIIDTTSICCKKTQLQVTITCRIYGLVSCRRKVCSDLQAEQGICLLSWTIKSLCGVKWFNFLLSLFDRWQTPATRGSSNNPLLFFIFYFNTITGGGSFLFFCSVFHHDFLFFLCERARVDINPSKQHCQPACVYVCSARFTPAVSSVIGPGTAQDVPPGSQALHLVRGAISKIRCTRFTLQLPTSWVGGG